MLVLQGSPEPPEPTDEAILAALTTEQADGATSSWTAAKQAVKIRAEGRDYQTQDGDVMEFRFTAPR